MDPAQAEGTHRRSTSPNLSGCLKTHGSSSRKVTETHHHQRGVSFGHDAVSGRTSPVVASAASNQRPTSSSFIEGRSGNSELKIVISVRGPSGTLPGPDKQRALAEAAAASLGVHPRGVQVHCYETTATAIPARASSDASPPRTSQPSSPFSPFVDWLGPRPAAISTAARPLFPPPTDDESASVARAPEPPTDMMVVL